MIKFVREGDIVVFHSMNRLRCNVVDLRNTIGQLTVRKIGVRLIKEGLTLTGDDSPIATLLLITMGSLAEFEVAGAGTLAREN